MLHPFLILFFLVSTLGPQHLSIAYAESHHSDSSNTGLVPFAAVSGVAVQNAGLASSSIQFSGTVDEAYDRITIPISNGQSANIGATDFSVEIWLRPSSTENNGSAFAWWSGNIFIDRDILGAGDRSYGMSLTNGQPTFMCHPDGGSKGEHTAAVDIRDDQWHWLVFTYDADTGQRQIYVDGTRRVQASGSSGDVSLDTPSGTAKDNVIELGGEKHFQGTPSFVGNMSEIRFSNVVRYTANSISVPTSELAVDANTVAYWGFAEGSGSVLADAASGDSDGTVVFGANPQVPVWSAESPYSGTSAGELQFDTATIDVDESQNQVAASVVRSGGSSGSASVNLATMDGSATAGADYQTTSTQLNWADGELGAKNSSVVLFPDSEPEVDETFTLELSSVVGSSLGSIQSAIVTILDDDPASSTGTIQYSQTSYSTPENGGAASITVSRANGTDGPISANYSTNDGTALAGVDYAATSGVISFVDGEGSDKVFQVDVLDDGLDEGNETIGLLLSGSDVGAPANAILTIVDDDVVVPQPGTIQFAVDAYTVNENESSIVVTATRNAGSDGEVSADYTTSDGSATAGSDYTTISGTVVFGDGETTSQSIAIPVLDDTVDESDETLQITLTSGQIGTPSSATITILDDDDIAPEPGTVQFAASTYSANENGSSITVTVTRNAGSDGEVSADYTTSNGSATAGSDYTATSGTVLFADGDTTSQNITIPVLDDTVDESDETLQLTLTSGQIGTPSSATITILDDDDASVPASSGGGALGFFQCLMLLALTIRLLARSHGRLHPFGAVAQSEKY